MRKIIAVVVAGLVLTGCSMNQDEILRSKDSCHRQNGVVSYNKLSDGSIMNVQCTIDGVIYRVGENTGKMFEGRVVE